MGLLLNKAALLPLNAMIIILKRYQFRKKNVKNLGKLNMNTFKIIED